MFISHEVVSALIHFTTQWNPEGGLDVGRITGGILEPRVIDKLKGMTSLAHLTPEEVLYHARDFADLFVEDIQASWVRSNHISRF